MNKPETYLEWVRMIARQVSIKDCVGMEEGDLVSYGYIGLSRAFDLYDEGRGTKFKTYAEHKVRSAMADAARKWRETKRSDNSRRIVGSIDSMSGNARKVAILRFFSEKEESHEIEAQIDGLYALLSKLDDNEQEAVFMRYWQGMKLTDIASVLKCNKFDAYKLINSGLDKLRKLVNGSDDK